MTFKIIHVSNTYITVKHIELNATEKLLIHDVERLMNASQILKEEIDRKEIYIKKLIHDILKLRTQLQSNPKNVEFLDDN